MKTDERGTSGFKVTDKFKARAMELLEESQTKQFVEGLRVNSAMANVFAREHERLSLKYGDDHPHTLEVKMRVEAAAAAETRLYGLYTESSTPTPKADSGWAVDGFVRTSNGKPVQGITVAPYDRQGRWYREFGYSCSDERGYFSIAVEKLPQEKEMRVYMRASYGEQLLKSNENKLAPVAGSSERIEIVIDDSNRKGDCMPPPSGAKVPDYPWAADQRAKDTTVKGPMDATGSRSVSQTATSGKTAVSSKTSSRPKKANSKSAAGKRAAEQAKSPGDKAPSGRK